MQKRKSPILIALFIVVIAAAGFWVSRLDDAAPPSSDPSSDHVATETKSDATDDVAERRKKRKEVLKTDTGRWRPSRDPDRGLSPEEIEQIDQLNALPYLQGYNLAPEQSDVTMYRPSLTDDGLNIYNSGHSQEAVVVNMDGRVLHRWHRPYAETFDDGQSGLRTLFWRRVYPFANGDLLVVFDGIGMAKLDRESNVIWASAHEQHHDIYLDGKGDIYTLTHRPELVERVNPREKILPDYLAIMSADGEVKHEVPLLEALEHSDYAHFLEGMQREGDIFHTNSVFVFDGSMAHIAPHFANGFVMVSILRLDLIVIIDPNSGRAVWAVRDLGEVKWHRQHDPHLLANGHLLLFDNRGYNKKSRILEFDARTLEIKWQYVGIDGEEFYSRTSGSVQRLPNGNTLITESDNGRAFEVTPDKDLVWEFVNPNRAGDNGELIATLFEMYRVPADFFEWIDASEVSD